MQVPDGFEVHRKIKRLYEQRRAMGSGDRPIDWGMAEQAIVPEGSTQFVFVVKDGVVEKRRVEMGRRIPGFVVIRDGLAEGERVISEGTGKVREGANVEDIADADL